MPEIDFTPHLAFRWYDDTDKQSCRRFNSGNYISFKLFTPYNRLLPFQIRRPTRPNLVTTFHLYTPEDVYYQDLLPLCPAGTFEYNTIDAFDIITYKATKDFTSNITEGFYYVLLSDGKQTWYSEVIYIGCEAMDTVVRPIISKPKGTTIILNNTGDIPVFSL